MYFYLVFCSYENDKLVAILQNTRYSGLIMITIFFVLVKAGNVAGRGRKLKKKADEALEKK